MAEECRSAVGCLINEASVCKPDALEKAGFKELQIPEMKGVFYARFPHISLLSIFIGMRRVHPALKSQAKVRRHVFDYPRLRKSVAASLSSSKCTTLTTSTISQ